MPATRSSTQNASLAKPSNTSNNILRPQGGGIKRKDLLGDNFTLNPKGKVADILRKSLTTPFSELKGDHYHAGHKEIVAYVNRSEERRHAEVEGGRKQGKVLRPANAYILYRKCYGLVAAQQARKVTGSQTGVSILCGVSWRLESKEGQEPFRTWAETERVNHMKAFPDYKFAPQMSKKNLHLDDDEEESDETPGSASDKVGGNGTLRDVLDNDPFGFLKNPPQVDVVPPVAPVNPPEQLTPFAQGNALPFQGNSWQQQMPQPQQMPGMPYPMPGYQMPPYPMPAYPMPGNPWNPYGFQMPNPYFQAPPVLCCRCQCEVSPNASNQETVSSEPLPLANIDAVPSLSDYDSPMDFDQVLASDGSVLLEEITVATENSDGVTDETSEAAEEFQQWLDAMGDADDALMGVEF